MICRTCGADVERYAKGKLCKDCYNEYMRSYLPGWRAARRAAWFADRPCVDCGSTENLELDHVDPSTKIDDNVWGWAADRREAELAKCVSRCHDCHLAKTKANQETVRGERHPRAKLNDDAVRAIRASSASNGTLAGIYGVSRPTIIAVRLRRSWNHVQ